MSNALEFEVVLEIAGRTYSDITYCSFLRAPLAKSCSFAIVRLFITQLVARQMIADNDKQNYVDVRFKVYLRDEITKKKKQQIFNQILTCLKVIPEGPITNQEDRMHVKLVLVHWILHYISNNNTYNVIEEDTTAYGALTKFEGWLNATFNGIFLPNHVGVDSNKYIYEQLLIRAPNDLSVPLFLINCYKASNFFGFYFFDSFSISDKRELDIINQYINFTSKHSFVKKDIFEYFDRSLTSNQAKIQNFSDLKGKFLFPVGNRFIYNHQEIKFEHEKLPTNCVLPRECPTGKTEIKLVKDRIVKNIPDIKKSSINYSSSAITQIYCPDDPIEAEKRFKNGEQIMSSIMNIQQYEISNCMPDFPQFGEIYNLEEHNHTNYNLTPINICNIFMRKNNRENGLYHLAKTTMLNYIND